jgi:hypothetical protein
VWTSSFEPYQSQKAPENQKTEDELLIGAVWLLESPKASNLKVIKKSLNKQHLELVFI